MAPSVINKTRNFILWHKTCDIVTNLQHFGYSLDTTECYHLMHHICLIAGTYNVADMSDFYTYACSEKFGIFILLWPIIPYLQRWKKGDIPVPSMPWRYVYRTGGKLHTFFTSSLDCFVPAALPHFPPDRKPTSKESISLNGSPAHSWPLYWQLSQMSFWELITNFRVNFYATCIKSINFSHFYYMKLSPYIIKMSNWISSSCNYKI